MANELKKIYKTTINHVVDGAAVSDGAWSAASDVDNACNSAAHGDYPYADVVLTVQMSAAPSAGETIGLYRRSVNIVGTNDEEEPGDNDITSHFMGTFQLATVTTVQYIEISGVPLTADCEFFIRNNCATADIAANAWDLDVKPWTYAPT